MDEKDLRIQRLMERIDVMGKTIETLRYKLKVTQEQMERICEIVEATADAVGKEKSR